MLKRYFGNRQFYKMALLVAVPIMIQNGITNFVGMLDNIMVGKIGTIEMTGVSIANTLIFVFNLAIFGAISGAGIFTAQFYGSNDKQGMRETFRFKLLICLLLTAIGVTIFLLFGDNLIRHYLQGEGELADIDGSFRAGKQYLLIMLIGLLPFAIVQCYSGTLRETGQTVVPMVAGIVSVCINLVFNYILIFGHFGAPRLGVRGAAIATVISRFAELVIVAVWTAGHKEKAPFIDGAFRSMRIRASLLKNIVKKGLPLLINETLWSGGMALLVQCYSLRSYNVVSATNISNTLTNVFSVAFIAMGNAIGIIVGQQLGAGETEKAKDTDRKLIVFSMLLTAIIAGVSTAFAWIFPKIYNTSDDIRHLATQLILVYAAVMPINCFVNAAYFTLRSGGKTFITFLFDSFYVWEVSVPAAYLLVHFTSIPIIPLYAIVNGLDFLKCIVGYILIKRGVWINNIVSKQGNVE